MEFLSKDEIQKADTLPHEDVPVPEWGGKVRVVTMTAGERDSYDDTIYRMEGTVATVDRKDFRSKMLIHCLTDEKKKRLFTEVKELSALSSKPIQRLYDVAQKLNGMSKEAQDDLKAK